MLYLKKKKNTWRNHYLHLCTKILHDMIYSAGDIEFDKLKLVIMGHFLTFFPTPPKNQNIWNFEKMKKLAGDIIILRKCTKNHDHMRYGS